jgi:tetratricopeptide (TPR) repeat protein
MIKFFYKQSDITGKPLRHNRMRLKKTITSAMNGKFIPSKYALVLALIGLAFAGAQSWADEADEVSKLIQRNQFEQAQARADAYLANRPNDAQMRFLKGLILTERNKTAEAITLFSKLTDDFPELPEPYNNLAVLYASKGDYEKARQSLEMAIRTHPSYATAHENLGDVYAKLASQSYDKALQLDGRNSAAQTKLTLVRNLISGKPEVVSVASTTTAPSKPAAPTKSTPAENKPTPPVAPPAASPPPPIAAAPTPVTIPTPIAPTKPPAPPPVVAKATESAISATKPTESKSVESKPNVIGMDSQVIAAVEAWAKAWSDQNMTGYLSAYSRDFETPGRLSRANWEKMREQRIVGKETIRIVVENPLITITGNQATVKFKQSYFSNRLNNISTKTLTMKQEGGSWKITNEKVDD